MSSFAVLPDVGPAATLALVVLALSPCLVRLWRAPSPAGFVHAVSYAAMCRYDCTWVPKRLGAVLGAFLISSERVSEELKLIQLILCAWCAISSICSMVVVHAVLS